MKQWNISLGLEYCTNHTPFLPLWQRDGFSLCFVETIVPSILCGLMLILAFIQLTLYRKRAKAFSRDIKPRNVGWRIQMFLFYLMPMEILFRLAVQFTVLEKTSPAGYMIVYTVTYMLAFIVAALLVLLERNYLLVSSPTHRHGVILLTFWTIVLLFEASSFVNMHSPFWWWKLESYDDQVELGLFLTRFTTALLTLVVGILAPGRLNTMDMKKYAIDKLEAKSLEEGIQMPLLNDGQPVPKKSTDSSLANLCKKLKIIAPYVWPKKDLKLQSCVIFSLCLLVAGRAANLLTPLYYKYIVDSLTDAREFRYDLILIYMFVRFLQGGAFGFLNTVRQFLWIAIQQYSTRELQISLFAHLHSLSLRWHLSRKTGEILRVVDRGTQSVNQLLDFVVFQILPTLADIAIAIIYFVAAFDAWFGLIIFTTMVVYLAGSAWLTEYRTRYRRTENLLDNESRQKAMDSLINFETVKYYNTEDYETNRYREAILNYQKAEWWGGLSMCILHLFQSFITNAGFMVAALLCAWMVVRTRELKVGDYVLLGTYIVQLYGPLGMLANFYRMIQMSFVDMENMFELLDEKKEVQDLLEAPHLKTAGGEIEFRNVYFSYEPTRPILKGISFKVKSGNTVALVGHTGSGKSTVIRLLFRFYDIQSGTILFDGQDISKVTQTSLRKAIGVVPQDTVLFNGSIGYNIRYGKITASDAEMEDAAKAADIHERILSFPQKYETVVGERGLKLSGGEKQRVAIARTVLKSPLVVMLDEATAALDTQTERHIQASLAKVYANRTTLIVAHRLSTVVNADEILVLKEGEIVERGSHQDLLSQQGLYYHMWEEQLKAPTKTDHESETSKSNFFSYKDKTS